MLGFVLRRLAQAVFVIWGTATLIFVLMVVVPEGDPARAIAPRSTPEILAAIRAEYKLDDPLPVQYGDWLKDIATGDLRSSFIGGQRPVTEIFAERFPTSAKLAALAILIELLVGIYVGIVSAVRRYSFWDYLVTVSTTILVSVPVFWLGSLLQYAFGWASWMPEFLRLPPTFDGSFASYILPAVTLASVSTAVLARVARSSMIEVLDSDYIKAARVRGLPERLVIGKHALKNALIPVITLFAIDFGILIGSAILTETVFSVPGVGSAIYLAILSSNTPVVMGGTLILTFVFVLLNLIADVGYAAVDPRIRQGVQGA